MKKPLTVLFVDDDAEDRDFFCEAMGIVDPSITRLRATNGPEALKMLNSAGASLPDYIFLDINMPIMNGKECLSILKSMGHLKHIPVIMCSTSIYTSDQQECEALGADFYLIKPNSLIKTISSFQYIFSMYSAKTRQSEKQEEETV